jgi:ribulose-5-phosphate 4-epimerase/fuculose-1-phosphate aldolase
VDNAGHTFNKFKSNFLIHIGVYTLNPDILVVINTYSYNRIWRTI